jgi:hypothetical protein
MGVNAGMKLGFGNRLADRLVQRLAHCVVAIMGMALFAGPAHAANCNAATSQGSTGPADWQSYCWIDFSTYNDAAARSAGGQAISLTLQDGTIISFKLNVSGAAQNAVASPSWTGAAVGNTAFLGITGKPVFYQTAAGTTTITFSNIVLTPPTGGTTTAYMFVAADAESSNQGETLSFQTNGQPWLLLDQVGPISGSIYPTTSGTGTTTFTETGVAGTVGAYIVGSSTPTTLTTTLVGGGLQGAMFAVRFATIRLTTQITGARAQAADQFTFNINATATGTNLASGTSSGTGLGPFTAASLSSAAALPLTLTQQMASGSTDTIAHYQSSLSCTNSSSGSSTPLPSNVLTTSYSFGSLAFGDAVNCTYTETPFPHLTLQKALAASGRQFATDQFVMNIDQGATNVATTTTTGSGATVTTGVTPQYQATAATTYKFSEAGAGTTVLAQYSTAMACTNAYAGSTTTLPTTPGGTITPKLGDVVTCTITNTKLAANALLSVSKLATPLSDPVNGTTNPKLIPGAVITYSFVVANTGATPVDSNTVWLIDALPAQLRVGTAATPVFTQGSPSSGLTFTAGTDIRYSNSATAPTSFAACTYTPTAAYDAAVRFVCLNPKGAMAGSTGTPPSFTLSIQAQLN